MRPESNRTSSGSRSLDGLTVALLEARRSLEISELVRRLGGIPYAVPAVREVSRLDEVPSFLDALAADRFSMVICLTGAGISRLLTEAQRLGRLDSTLAALNRATTVCRGPKPAAVLRQHNVAVGIRAGEPHTTKELLEALEPIDLAGRSVAVLHYGERHQPLADALRARGAVLDERCLYEWRLPEDVGPLQTLAREIVAGRVHAIAFTSQIQCRHLFEVASTVDLAGQLLDALKNNLTVAAIGPVCVAALAEYGITPHVVPRQSKMGQLIIELADYFSR
jgi:uroporphyrinogen-III synthase